MKTSRTKLIITLFIIILPVKAMRTADHPHILVDHHEINELSFAQICCYEPFSNDTFITSITFGPTGDQLALGRSNGEIIIVNKEKIEKKIKGIGFIESMVFYDEDTVLSIQGLKNVSPTYLQKIDLKNNTSTTKKIFDWSSATAISTRSYYDLGPVCVQTSIKRDTDLWALYPKTKLKTFVYQKTGTVTADIAPTIQQCCLGGYKKTITLFDIESGSSSALKTGASTLAMAYTPDSQKLVIASEYIEDDKPTITIWNLNDSKKTKTIELDKPTSALAISHEGQVAYCLDLKIYLFNLDSEDIVTIDISEYQGDGCTINIYEKD